jgi:hypothetical protein
MATFERFVELRCLKVDNAAFLFNAQAVFRRTRWSKNNTSNPKFVGVLIGAVARFGIAIPNEKTQLREFRPGGGASGFWWKRVWMDGGRANVLQITGCFRRRGI